MCRSNGHSDSRKWELHGDQMLFQTYVLNQYGFNLWNTKKGILADSLTVWKKTQ